MASGSLLGRNRLGLFRLYMNNSDYLKDAMNYIIGEALWIEKFPRQCRDRIIAVCEAVKDGKPLPFNNDDNSEHS